MRLSKKQLDAIHRCFIAHFLPLDALWLFGSRVDDLQKGGDIDFYVETNYDSAEAIEKQIYFLRDVKKEIGDQKIDVVLNIMSEKKQHRIYDEAKNTGIRLV